MEKKISLQSLFYFILEYNFDINLSVLHNLNSCCLDLRKKKEIRVML